MEQHRNWASEFEQQIMKELAISLSDAIGSDAHVNVTLEHRLKESRASIVTDGMIEIHTHNKTLTIYVEVINNGYPRDIRNAVWRLNVYQNALNASNDVIRMVAANSLSPGAKNELKALNVAFYELGGSLYLKHDYWLINIEKPSKPSKTKGRIIDLFTDARENVIHTVLMHNHDWFSGTELAHLAQTSQYTSSLVLQELTLREWSEETGGGPSKRRKLTQPRQLLDAWAKSWQNRKDEESKWYTFVENPNHLIRYLSEQIVEDKIDFPWAFTGTAAANMVAPLLTSTDSAEIIVPNGYTEMMAKILNLQPAQKGGNITLIERQGASLLFRQKPLDHPAYLVSPYILYLDLLNGRGRNKELAEHIRKYLESLWVRS